MSEKGGRGNNDLGVVGVVLGILSIVFSGSVGIVIGITGLVFAMKQKKKHMNKWSKYGITLNAIGIILGIVVTIVAVQLALNNPNIVSQLQNLPTG